MDNRSRKRRRIEVDRFISTIMEVQNKKWLVEWNDKTRSWESYDNLKDLEIFQEYILKYCNNTRNKKVPSYII